jgi:hypothetical protein
MMGQQQCCPILGFVQAVFCKRMCKKVSYIIYEFYIDRVR